VAGSGVGVVSVGVVSVGVVSVGVVSVGVVSVGVVSVVYSQTTTELLDTRGWVDSG
jgi:hypothetical protein